ncbi:hypothetical protein [Paenibacillus sp. sgz500958]|uniref:hypothetical protein n=1 Tax=Paenibacillus sp. sgz500958 TaxID=3242475 RepID=UPI0036D301FB
MLIEKGETTLEQRVRSNRFGFSFNGIVILFLVLLPNVLFYIFAVQDSTANSDFADSYQILGYFEHASQLILMLLLVFRVHSKPLSMKSRYVMGMALFLILYYALWVRYFAGGRDDYGLISESFPVYMGMAISPAVYFAFAGKWRGDRLGVASAITFGVLHALNTYLNFAI